MSEWYNRYQRISSVRGGSTGEAMTSRSEQFINSKFKDSPSYKRAKVTSTQYPDLDEIDTRVVSIDRMGTLRDVIFRPNEGVDKGTYLHWTDNGKPTTWLVFDAYLNTISPKVTVQQCNEYLKFEGADGKIHQIYVYAGATGLGSKASQLRAEIPYNKLDIKEPTSQLFIYMESNEYTNKLDVNHRLIIGRRAFKIIGKDDTTYTQIEGNGDGNQRFNFGILAFTLTLDTIKAGDNIEEGIAQNFGEGNENWGNNSVDEQEAWGDW